MFRLCIAMGLFFLLNIVSLWGIKPSFYPMGRRYSDLKVSPDKKYIATSVYLTGRTNNYKKPTNFRNIQIIDAVSGELVSILDEANSLKDMLFDIPEDRYNIKQHFIFSDDSEYLYTYSVKHILVNKSIIGIGKWDISTGKEVENIELFSNPAAGSALHFEVHNDTLFLARDLFAESIEIIPLKNPSKKTVINTGRLFGFKVLTETNQLISMCGDHSLSIYDYNGNLEHRYDLESEIKGYKKSEHRFSHICSFVQSGSLVFMQGVFSMFKGTFSIMKIDLAGKVKIELNSSHRYAPSIKSFDISEDGTKLLVPVNTTAYNKYAVLEMDISFKKLKMFSIPPLERALQSVFYTAGGIVGHCESSYFFYIKDGEFKLGTIPLNHVNSFYVTNDDKYLICTEINGYTTRSYPKDRSIYAIYDIKSEQVIARKSFENTLVQNRLSAYCSKSNELFIPVNNKIFSYKLPDFSNEELYSGHSAPVTSISLTTDSTRLISASMDSTIIVWDIKSKEILYRKKIDRPVLNAIAISGNRILYFSKVKYNNPKGYILNPQNNSIEDTPIRHYGYSESKYDNYSQHNTVFYNVGYDKLYYTFHEDYEIDSSYALSYNFKTKKKVKEFRFPYDDKLGGMQVIATQKDDFVLAERERKELFLLYNKSENKFTYKIDKNEFEESIFSRCISEEKYPTTRCNSISIAMDSKGKKIFFATIRGTFSVLDISSISSVKNNITNNLEDNILLYPNPINNGKLNVTWDDTKEFQSVMIYSIRGQKLMEIPISVGKTNINLDISNLKTGGYLLRLVGKEIQNKIFIIE